MPSRLCPKRWCCNMLSNTLTAQRVTWLLSGQLADDQPVRNVRVGASRFTVGRKPEASLCIPSPTVSREHAELTVVDRGLLLRDLGSTNGTSVNGVRITEPCTVRHGDLIQFGQIVFRVVQQRAESGPQTIQDDSCDRALAMIQFDQLMTQRADAPQDGFSERAARGRFPFREFRDRRKSRSPVRRCGGGHRPLSQ